MDYKKMYEEALERAKYLKENTDSVNAKDISYTFEYIFPELGGSEDERIRKAIGYAICQSAHSDGTLTNSVTSKEALAWLEKQGEQKSTIQYNYVKFREGDTVQKITGDKDIVTIAEVDTEAEVYRLTNTGFIPFKYEHLWHIVEQKSSWSEDDEQNLNFWLDNNKSIDSDKRNWLRSLKDRVQPQPKQEWSEEDKEMLYNCLGLIQEIDCTQEEQNWLKSLIKPQNRWKPSEQNIKDLEWCADLVKDKMGVGFHRLQVFIDELKNNK